MPDLIFGEATAVGTSAEKSDHDYNNKTEFQVWKYKKEFERQNILMSLPPFGFTLFGSNTTNTKISHLDLTPVVKKTPGPKPLTIPMEYPKQK